MIGYNNWNYTCTSRYFNLSPPIGTFTTYATVKNTEINLDTTAIGATTGAVAATSTSYTLSDIGFRITRYDMPQSYFDAVTSVIQGGAIFKLYYPNYSTFLWQLQSIPKRV